MHDSRIPSDSELQRMGIVRVDTMLPPSPSMLQAGARALADAALAHAPPLDVLERAFKAMVLEGMADMRRLGGAVRAGTPASLAQAAPSQCFCNNCYCSDEKWSEWCTNGGAGEHWHEAQVAAKGATVPASGATVTATVANAPALQDPTRDRSDSGVRIWHTNRSEATVSAKPPGIQESNGGHLNMTLLKKLTLSLLKKGART